MVSRTNKIRVIPVHQVRTQKLPLVQRISIVIQLRYVIQNSSVVFLVLVERKRQLRQLLDRG